MTSLVLGVALPCLLGVVAWSWLVVQGRPVAPWREGVAMVLLPTFLLVLPMYAVFARIAFVRTMRTGDNRPQAFRLRGALLGLTLPCGAILLGLFIEGQASLLALMVVPFWAVCAAGAGLGYWLGAVVAGATSG